MYTFMFVTNYTNYSATIIVPQITNYCIHSATRISAVIFMNVLIFFKLFCDLNLTGGILFVKVLDANNQSLMLIYVYNKVIKVTLSRSSRKLFICRLI